MRLDLLQPGASRHTEHTTCVDCPTKSSEWVLCIGFITVETTDLRQSVENWKKFFADHKTYFKVGRVLHPPVDPQSPVPEHCNPKKEEPARSSDHSGKPLARPGPLKSDKPELHQEL